MDEQTIEPELPSRCRCPHCGLDQSFRKGQEHWKTVKVPSLTGPIRCRARVVYAKCENPQCAHRYFALPLPGVARYQRAATDLIHEGVAGLVADNTTLERTAQRLNRSLNTTASRSALDRWKQRVAERYELAAIIPRLGFSGALCLDEYLPRRSRRYEQLAGDAIRKRLLYLEPVPEGRFQVRGVTEDFCRQLDGWGVHPYCVLFDLLTTFPKVVRKVWPQALLQFDYFHVMQWLWHFLRNALVQYRKSLQGAQWEAHRSELWEMRWRLLMRMDHWGPKDHQRLPEMMAVYAGTIVEQVLLFKEQLWDIFDVSETQQEAYAKRDALAQEAWWRNSWHLTKAVQFLLSPKFELMTTYLKHKEVPRCGHSETLINVWRQMEAVRRGFKSDQARLNHLKLFQITHYLKEPITGSAASKSGQTS